MILKAIKKWIYRNIAPARIIDVDTVIIGSGPYSLVCAIAELKEGRTTLIMDKQAVLGGAWAPHSLYKVTEEKFDAVAHLLSVYPTSYSLLEEAGLLMINRSIYFWDAQFSAEKTVILNELTDDAFNPISNDCGHLMAYHQYYALQRWHEGEAIAKHISVVNCPEFKAFRYFTYSFKPVVDRLAVRFAVLGGQLALGTKVEEISLDQKGVRVTSGDLVVTARHAISGRHMNCRILVDGVEIHENIIENHYRSLLILAKFEHILAYQYINVVNHPEIQAIQIARSESYEDDFVYSICIISMKDYSSDPLNAAQGFMSELEKSGIFESAGLILSVHFHHYVSHSHSSDFLNGISEMCPSITFKIVDNMSACIAANEDQWAYALRP